MQLHADVKFAVKNSGFDTSDGCVAHNNTMLDVRNLCKNSCVQRMRFSEFHRLECLKGNPTILSFKALKALSDWLVQSWHHFEKYQ